MRKGRNKVLVGMSGGVDSSVAALLLKRQGFNVAGCFMVFEESGNACCSLESRKAAKDAANAVGIPFYCIDVRREFKNKVVSRFISDHGRGLTPNPCVECNKEIKFGIFLKKALVSEFDYIATGHYARKRRGGKGFELLEGKDKNKDQSYFLWKLGQNQLKRLLFPLGDLRKEETRKIAKEFGLPNFKAEESQEICFANARIRDFLEKHIGIKKGNVVDLSGEKLGEHRGLHFHTIGQRKGLGFPGGPYFVIRKDLKKNLLIVSRDRKDLSGRKAVLSGVNWISGEIPKLPLNARVKIRYRHEPARAVINRESVIFEKPQKSITPGQSAVFYKRNTLLGGGTIVRVDKEMSL